MLRVLIWKELLQYLRSLRFSLSFVSIVVLFIVGAVAWNARIDREWEDYQHAVRESEDVLGERAQQSLHHLYFATVAVWNPPSLLSFASAGYGRGMPNAARIWRASWIEGFEQRADRNPLLFRMDLDWVFIVGTLGTLVVLLLTYDAIAGEKERGSLRQMLANRLPRDQVILAKYIAAMVVASVPVLVGCLISLLVVGAGGHLGLTGSALPALGGVAVASFLCLSAFVWLGLWASSRTHNTALALLGSLLVWSLLVVFLPHSGILVGDRLVDVPRASEARRSFWPWPQNRGAEGLRQLRQAQHRYWSLLVRQVEAARLASLASPVTALRGCAEVLTWTGVPRHRSFVDQAQGYLLQLESFVREQDSLDPDSSHEMTPHSWPSVSTKPVSPEAVPRYRFREPEPAHRVARALPSILVLLFANGVCFLGAYFSFRRYDVR